jgi:hypothetical protein
MAEVHPYKKFSAWWMQCINTVISLLKVLVKSRAVHNMPVAKSPKLLVLGTGPSFKISLNKNLAYFQSHPVLVVNSFSVTDTYTKIKPAYYAMLDPGIWLGDIEVMNNTLHAIQTDTTWPMVLFLPREAGVTSIMWCSKVFLRLRISFFDAIEPCHKVKMSWWLLCFLESQ